MLPISSPPPALSPHEAPLQLRFDVRRPTARVQPDRVLGWSLDGVGEGQNAPLFDARNRLKLQALGKGPVSYRLRTELAGEVWHWSAHGRWSDASRRQGYWTGDALHDDRSPVTYGYRLPRRGNSRDEANDDGYSRLDDGDPASFWKSDPYLAKPYIGASAERPEWIKIDLGAARPVDGLEVLWREPFARRLRVQFWTGGDASSGHWTTFPAGDLRVARSGVFRVELAPTPRPVQFVRLLMEDSSRTAPPGSTDPRDSLGYAVAEVRLGVWRGANLADAIRHAPNGREQTRMVVSSTDPWHRSGDRDPAVEQPSPLYLMRLGLLQPGRATLPVGVLYDTPEDAAAEVSYFRRFGLRPREVELGEEPEGQQTDPEVFARLFAQVARALSSGRSEFRILAPSLINYRADTSLDDGDRSWTRRMLKALRVEAPANALQGFTLEHYPEDDICADAWRRLRRGPKEIAALFARLHDDGVPPDTPLTLTEIGQSAFNGQADVELVSGLFAAETLAEFLSRGGHAAYLYGFTPATIPAGAEACAGAGDMMSYQLDGAGLARWALPSLVAQELVQDTWLQRDGSNRLFPPTTAKSSAPVFAYAAHRPDGRWAVMLINPEPRAQAVRLQFDGGGPRPQAWSDSWSYGADQYQWSAADKRPSRDAPPSRGPGHRWGEPLVLQPRSLTVVRTR